MILLRVATTNRGKLREFRQILSPLGYSVLGIEDLSDLNIVEDGSSFAENAITKARVVSNATAAPAVADDSGLEVDALAGQPGIFSARYAGVDGPDRDRANRERLLSALEGVSAGHRTARFVCALALFVPHREPVVFRGELAGQIGFVERGENGFGYDAIFEIPGDGRTAAELPAADKNAISHRGRAIVQLVDYLRTHGPALLGA